MDTQSKIDLIEQCTISAYDARRRKTGSPPWNTRTEQDQRKYREIVQSAFAELERQGKEIVDQNQPFLWCLPIPTLEDWHRMVSSGQIIRFLSIISSEIETAREEAYNGS